MSQAVAEFTPRVRRAIEGPIPLADGAPGRLTDGQVEALAADAIADIILQTAGNWPRQLIRVALPPDESWAIEPAIPEVEQRMIAMQSALNFFFFVFQNAKTSEAITNEGQSYEWTKSAQAMVEQMRTLKDERDKALAGLLAEFPIMARYASILAVRDYQHYALIERWRVNEPDTLSSPLGGQLIYP